MITKWHRSISQGGWLRPNTFCPRERIVDNKLCPAKHGQIIRRVHFHREREKSSQIAEEASSVVPAPTQDKGSRCCWCCKPNNFAAADNGCNTHLSTHPQQSRLSFCICMQTICWFGRSTSPNHEQPSLQIQSNIVALDNGSINHPLPSTHLTPYPMLTKPFWGESAE